MKPPPPVTATGSLRMFEQLLADRLPGRQEYPVGECYDLDRWVAWATHSELRVPRLSPRSTHHETTPPSHHIIRTHTYPRGGALY